MSKRSGNKNDNGKVENIRIACESLESNAEECDECEAGDDGDWQENSLQVRKTQEKLGDQTAKIEEKTQKMKEKRRKKIVDGQAFGCQRMQWLLR